MKFARWALVALLVGSVAVLAQAGGGQEVPLKKASVIVEINSTDGDAGLQPSLDGEPWKRVEVFWPDGRPLFDLQTSGDLADYGLTELFSESSEPPFSEFPLDQFQQLFPEGEYRIEAIGIDGTRMVGTDNLTHDFPAGPEIISPTEDEVVSRRAVTIRWEPVTTPAGIDIVAYQVLVVSEDPLQTFAADLAPTATSLKVPAEFLVAGREYKVEVLAIEASGNQTLSELTFTTK